MTGGRSNRHETRDTRHETAALLNLASRVSGLVSIWVGALDLVHLDVPVRVLRSEPLDPLHRLLLRAVEVAPAGLDELDTRLGLGRAPLFRWLDELCGNGLLEFHNRYELTPAGSTALAGGTALRSVTERRRFTFVLGLDTGAHYLPWALESSAPVPAPSVDAHWLDQCIARPAAWKRRAGFPEDVVGVEVPGGASGAAAWRRLTVATAQRPTVAVVLTGDRRVAVFSALSGDPAARLDAGWEEAFPELAGDPTAPRTEIGDGWVLLGDGRLRRAEKMADTRHGTRDTR